MQFINMAANPAKISRLAYQIAKETGEVPMIVEHMGTNVPVIQTIGNEAYNALCSLTMARR